jgi:crotonobetainyl-CoA:carnitine CoA-transferase CaiB-like acyl-CoA transferase
VSSVQERPPYEAYAAIAGSFAGLLAAAGALGRLLDRDPQCQTSLDFAILALASFKAARTLAHDRVTAPMRAPFVEGEADAHDEVPVRTGGMQQAIGELVTCTRCVGTWAAAGLASTQIVAPRFGRLLTWSLGAAAANDFLQAGFNALCGKADELS